ncbi:MAG: hypothetical protein Q4A63_01215 [Butyricicoccus pullicaecorum]|nr:hypothetical protein [Butyricicoccus pullicaecorum]MDO4668415.1 hypothetical protein [Butyricicoccus pullicaecorum]
MKFLAKFSIILLILGGIFFGIGNAMGGTVYSLWYNGDLHPWYEAKKIGFFSYDSLRDVLHEQAHDIVEEIRESFSDIAYTFSDLVHID